MEVVAWISIALAVACALWVAADVARRPQPMAVMNVVWPVTALYFTVVALWAYYRVGRAKAGVAVRHHHGAAAAHQEHASAPPPTPFLWQVAVGTSHCGAGCMIADVVCEFAIAASGLTLLGSMLLAEYIVDFCAAWALGVVFQYLAIKPMRAGLTSAQALAAAVKADTLSILAFQVGMYAWMALVYFLLFPRPHLTAFNPYFWFMMQIAMVCGFFTSFPVNRWLIRAGFKEAM